MENVFSAENLRSLINKSKDDKEMLEFIADCLKSFEKYHSAIYEMETWLSIFDYNALGRENYQSILTGLDKTRRVCHNAVLSSVNILNRTAQKAGVDLIYNGVVSEEKPYRREVADAVLKFAEDIILNRR